MSRCPEECGPRAETALSGSHRAPVPPDSRHRCAENAGSRNRAPDRSYAGCARTQSGKRAPATPIPQPPPRNALCGVSGAHCTYDLVPMARSRAAVSLLRRERRSRKAPEGAAGRLEHFIRDGEAEPLRRVILLSSKGRHGHVQHPILGSISLSACQFGPHGGAANPAAGNPAPVAGTRSRQQNGPEPLRYGLDLPVPPVRFSPPPRLSPPRRSGTRSLFLNLSDVLVTLSGVLS